MGILAASTWAQQDDWTAAVETIVLFACVTLVILAWFRYRK